MTIQIDVKEHGPVRRELRIEVDPETVGQALVRVLDQVAKNARIPGFRPGKVPRALLRRRFAREIENEVLEQLVPAAVGDALRQTGLAPVHQPVIKDVALAEQEPLRFTASFEVRPAIEPRDYKGIAVQVPQARVEEADVERELQALRESVARYETEEPRPIRRGDFVLADLRSREGDEERSQEGALIEVGGEEYHPEFARNLEGAEPGAERTFRVAYAADDPDPRARGKDVEYTVRITGIKRKVLPDLDDELAKDLGDHATLAELRASLRERLEKRLERDRARHLERQLMDALVPSVGSEVPQSLVEAELDHLVEEQARALALRGIDPRTAPVDWRATRDKLREHAVRKVKWELMLEAIADKEAIEASDADVEERLRELAEGSGRSLEYLRSRIAKDGRMEELKASVRLKRAVDFLLRNARMEAR